VRTGDVRCHAHALIVGHTFLSWMELLHIRNLRCIQQAELALSQGLIWFFGGNGAGKTTLLEAAYVLDRGRSFRGRRAGPLRTHGADKTQLSAVLIEGESRWALRWVDGQRSDGPRPRGAVRFVGASTFGLLEGGPSLRRRFIDWSMFHVEPGAGLALGNAGRLAQQRNAWLRSGARGYRVWDGGYAEAYAVLAEHRCRFVGAVNTIFVQLTASLFPGGPLSLEWEGSLSASEAMSALSRQWAADRSRGFTQLSPWRGDLVIIRGDRRWGGSRGENKLAAMLLQLAVHRVAAETCPSAVVLVDDPYGEVSPALVLPVLREWVSQADQVLVAALSEPPAGLNADKVFHVEHGQTSVLARHC